MLDTLTTDCFIFLNMHGKVLRKSSDHVFNRSKEIRQRVPEFSRSDRKRSVTIGYRQQCYI